MFIMIFVELMSEVRSGYIHPSHVFFYKPYAFHNINLSETILLNRQFTIFNV